MKDIFTKMQWDLIEYEINKSLYLKEKEQKEKPSTVPLSSLRKKNRITDIEEGYVKETKAGNYIERRVTNLGATGNKIVRLKNETLFDGDVVKTYVRKRDCLDVNNYGAFFYQESIRVMKENTTRKANIKQVKRSCENFKWLVRANQSQIRLFITLTYAENMTDTKRLYQDFREFWQRLKRHCKDDSLNYLVAFEPQKRGAWHAHILLISTNAHIRIPNKKMRKIWGFGFTKVQAVKNIHDLGSYLTAYLTNIKRGSVTKKGARLELYPSGFHFLRHSKFIRYHDVRRWYGRFDTIENINIKDYDLIIDYINYRDVSLDLFKISKILCLEKKRNLSISA